MDRLGKFNSIKLSHLLLASRVISECTLDKHLFVSTVRGFYLTLLIAQLNLFAFGFLFVDEKIQKTEKCNHMFFSSSHFQDFKREESNVLGKLIRKS